MHRLRHPIRSITEPYGKAGLTVAIIALILALGGTALAAKGALTGKQKKEVEKIAKKYAGKPGATGPAGPQGPAGANGKDGANGANGTSGQDGADGESVTVNSYTGAECEGEGEKGAEFTNSTGTAYACNGKEGSPWTAGGTLPAEATETGAWGGRILESHGSWWTISFPLPLPEPLDEEHVIPVRDGEPVGEFCDDGAGEAPSLQNPEADPGYLCVFESPNGLITNIANLALTALGADKTGAVIIAQAPEGQEPGTAVGSWAVTAPEGP